MEMPTGEGVLHGPGEMECAGDTVRHCVNIVLGTTDDEIVAVLPDNSPGWRVEEAVSSNARPVAYCELACTESCEHVSADFDGEDILLLH